MMESFYRSDCMRKEVEFATSQINVNYCAAGGWGNQCDVGGCNIDQNSSLLLGALQTHPKCRISLFQRPFATVPYLGRGPFDPMMESKLQQTDTFSNNKKSVNTLSELSYMPMSNYPLIPSIQKTVTNPAYLVEGVALHLFIWFGQLKKALPLVKHPKIRLRRYKERILHYQTF